jgi:hypothetical protein
LRFITAFFFLKLVRRFRRPDVTIVEFMLETDDGLDWASASQGRLLSNIADLSEQLEDLRKPAATAKAKAKGGGDD